MLALEAAPPVGAVLESNLYRTWAAGDLGRLPGLVVDVICRCGSRSRPQPYRLRSGTRAAGHFDALRTDEELERRDCRTGSGRVRHDVQVDTDVPVDPVTVVAAVRAAMSAWEELTAHRIIPLICPSSRVGRSASLSMDATSSLVGSILPISTMTASAAGRTAGSCITASVGALGINTWGRPPAKAAIA